MSHLNHTSGGVWVIRTDHYHRRTDLCDLTQTAIREFSLPNRSATAASYSAVIHLDAPFAARNDIKAIAWDATHRQWTDSEWRLDVAALDQAVRHLLELGYTGTVATANGHLFVADFEAPFLETLLAVDPSPVDDGLDGETGSDAQQSDHRTFDRDSCSNE